MMDEIRAATVGAVVWDRGDKQSIKGLHLRVISEKRKSFYLFYRTKTGNQRRPKIGDFGDITLAQARKRAKDLLDLVALGKDPKGDWDLAKGEMSVSELYNHTAKNYWSSERFQRSGWIKHVKSFWKCHLEEAFGRYRLSEVSIAMVKNWHRDKQEFPYAANRALEVLSRMFNFAEEEGLIPMGSNPCSRVKAFKERKRKRYATPDEIRAVWKLLGEREKKSPRGVAFLKVMLLTGTRPRALEQATWRQLKIQKTEDGEIGILTFEGKSTEETGEEEQVVFPPEALSMIRALPSAKNGLLIGCKLPRTLWENVRKASGCGDLWARDLRRTFATIGMSGGVEQAVVGELLNHKTTQTTKIYAKLMADARVEAATSIAKKVTSITSGTTILGAEGKFNEKHIGQDSGNESRV